MQKINRVFFGVLILSSMHAYTLNTALLQQTTKKIEACNLAARANKSSPAECVFNALTPPTRDAALASLREEIGDKRSQLNKLEETLQDTTHTDTRNKLESQIKVFIQGIAQLDQIKTDLTATSADQYKTKVSNLSNVDFMNMTSDKVASFSGYIAHLDAEMAAAVTAKELSTLSREKFALESFIHENTESLHAVLVSWEVEMENLRTKISLSKDDAEKAKLGNFLDTLNDTHGKYTTAYKALLLLTPSQK